MLPNNTNIHTDTGWNKELEILLRDIKEKCWAYTWLHNTSVTYFNKWNDNLSIVGIAIDILTGTSIFATLNNCTKMIGIQIGTGVIIYIGALIGGYTHYYKLSERADRHKLAASKYSTLYHSIQKELALSQKERQNAKDFITCITNQYDSLMLSSPDLEDSILKKYFNHYKNNDLVMYDYDKNADQNDQDKIPSENTENTSKQLVLKNNDIITDNDRSSSNIELRNIDTTVQSSVRGDIEKAINGGSSGSVNKITFKPVESIQSMRDNLAQRCGNIFSQYYNDDYDANLMNYQMHRMKDRDDRAQLDDLCTHHP